MMLLWALIRRICVPWCSGQSIGLLISLWVLAYCIPAVRLQFGSRRNTPLALRILWWANLWNQGLAWSIARVQASRLAPRPSLALALIGTLGALTAYVCAWVFGGGVSLPLNGLTILFCWLSALCLPQEAVRAWAWHRNKGEER